MVFLISCFLLFSALAQEIYHWTDENGVEHYTDDLGQVPPKHRPKYKELVPAEKKQDKKLKVEKTTKGEELLQPIEILEKLPEDTATYAGSADKMSQDERYWRGRVAQTKRKLSEKEKALDKAYEEKRQIYTYFYPGSHERLASVQSDIDRLEKEIKELKYELEVQIPREARQAGVPPGWVR